MAGTNIEKIKEYIAEISKICEIEQAYIFGSFVKTNDVEHSDIDLALISYKFNEENFIDYLSRFLIISAGSSLNIEPHLFNTRELDDDFLQQEVLCKGIKIST
ncbi:MAG: nucleotidyltransferase domain-containing protein [Candidatus Aminicenantes bacterium]|nr:nucleotidyltransferase domain-containing protein [Candidatus Aminicenantes bacterium]